MRFVKSKKEIVEKAKEIKGFSRISAAVFIAVLALAFIVNAVIPDKRFSSKENRLLQEFPAFTPASYFEGRYENKLEAYCNDQFVLRNKFIKIKSAADITAGKLEANGVYRAGDGYLLEDMTIPKKAELDNTVNALHRFRYRHTDMNMYFLLAPNAGNIYSEKLPGTVKLSDQNVYMDDFFNRISYAGYTVIDVRNALRKKKAEKGSQLYYRTDHHWTSEGAYTAYMQLVRDMHIGAPTEYRSYAVTDKFCGSLTAKSGFTNGVNDAINIYLPKNKKKYENSVIYYSDSKEKTTGFYRTDNLKKGDAYKVFGGSNHPMYTIKTPVHSTKKLLVVKDSYANSLIPLLTQHYREIVVVDPRYYYDSIEELMVTEGVTDVLFAYNANTFFADTSLALMLGSE